MTTEQSGFAYHAWLLVMGALGVIDTIRTTLGPIRDYSIGQVPEGFPEIAKSLAELKKRKDEVFSCLTNDILATVRRCNSQPIRLLDGDPYPFASNLEAGIGLANIAIGLQFDPTALHKYAMSFPVERGRELATRVDQELAHLGVGDALAAWTEVQADHQRIAADRATAAQKATSAPNHNVPRRILRGSKDICAVLSMKYTEWKQVKRLNKKFEGPIRNDGRGTKPMVYLDELITWWDSLAIRQQEMANQRDGKKLSADEQFPIGREGTVAPQIQGAIKRRRQR